MTDPLTAAIATITARLGLAPCPCCDQLVPVARAGGPALCLPCTELEIGLTRLDNAARIAAGLSLAQMRRREPDQPLPATRENVFARRVYAVPWTGGWG